MGYHNLKFEKDSVFLVTGGAGFIGSNLCEALTDMGYQVRCLDDLSTGKEKNVQMFMDRPNYTFIKGDIKDLETCIKACDGVDYVLHQAAWGSVPRSIEMPLFYEEGNLLSPYALTKRTNEEYGKLYKKLYQLDTYGMRYFNVFGRRQDPEGAYAAVIPKFIKQLLDGEVPTINGDGQQSRDFTYIDNVIEANLKACLASSDAAGQAFNIAYGGREYLIDIYYDLCKALGKEVEPQFGPDRAGDIKHSNADITKAKELLGYAPEYNFEQGIALAIDWYRENL